MIHWHTLASTADVERVVELSKQQPCIIFKHSTSCSISAIAKHRLEQAWRFTDAQVMPFYLDLLAYRPVSNFITSHLGVDHESPQLLVIQDGICVFDTSHLDISVDAIDQFVASTV